MSNVDDLLAELDGMLDGKRGKQPDTAAERMPSVEDYLGSHSSFGEKRREDPSDGLDSLLDLTRSPKSIDTPPISQTRRNAGHTSTRRRDDVVLLGVRGSVTQSIQCVKCDFQVLRFKRSRWTPDVDYLFFRNYMPNTKKMSAKLLYSESHAAYACQCTWQSVDSEVLLSRGTSASTRGGTANGSDVQWVPSV